MKHSIVTWNDIYEYIKSKNKVTKRELINKFDRNCSNISRKLNGLKNHDMIIREGEVIYAK